MFDFLGINAKTHIPALGESVIGFVVRVNECLQPAALKSCSSILSGRRADQMARCGWMDGANSPVAGKAWKEEARELEQQRISIEIKKEQGGSDDDATARETNE